MLNLILGFNLQELSQLPPSFERVILMVCWFVAFRSFLWKSCVLVSSIKGLITNVTWVNYQFAIYNNVNVGHWWSSGRSCPWERWSTSIQDLDGSYALHSVTFSRWDGNWVPCEGCTSNCDNASFEGIIHLLPSWFKLSCFQIRKKKK